MLVGRSLSIENKILNQNFFIGSVVILIAALFACIPKSKLRSKPIGNWLDTVQYAWKELLDTQSLCIGEDAFPNGGMQDLYCHLKNFASLKELESYFGESVFLSGPHISGYLVLDDRYEFGHYNPSFPKFLAQTLIPASKDSGFKTVTQPIYELYIKNLARTFFATYKKLHSNQIYLVKERIRYNRLRKDGILDPFYFEKYKSFMHPQFSDDEDEKLASKFVSHADDIHFNGDIVKTCVAFWIRRSIDQSDKAFLEGLNLLLITYDPNYRNTR